MRRLPALALPVLLAAGLAAAPVTAAAATPAAGPSAATAGLPRVTPTPQSMAARGPAVPLGHRVAVVTGADSDAAAVSSLTDALSAAGVRTVDRVSAGAALPGDEPALYVGGAGENAASAPVLAALAAPDPAVLPAEGYVLVDGKVHGRASVVLAGHDASGTFYAVQTLRQLIRNGRVPGVVVKDWPDTALRGTIEGFYGTPWSDEQRLAQMDFYGRHKMNSYVYSPKDDAYLRDKWRDEYPADQLAVLKTLVQRATANHVQFTYALSPGLSVCYTSADDEQALVAKFQSLWDIGVRSFSIPLDDISYTNWNCDADQAKFGTGGGAAGQAQAYLLNEVQRDFIATHPGAQRLQMVPTEYSDLSATPYKAAIKADLDPAVIVGWTGVGVIATTITGAQAAQARSVFGHDILLWDNYPVNDYVTDRLLLGPYVGRSADMTANLVGVTANPMIQPEASKMALIGVADEIWNGAAYDPEQAYQDALDELSGGDTRARTALAAFSDLERYSQLDPHQAPALAARIDRFWPAWERGNRSAAGQLDDYLTVIEHAQQVLTDRMHDPEFVTETTPWLDATTSWGTAARDALAMLVAERAGNGARALRLRAAAQAAVAKAKSYTYVGLRGTVTVTVGDGVIDKFVDDALAENARWLGLAGRHVAAATSLPTYQSNVPARMVDGDDSTFFWASTTPSAGDYVGVDLGAVEPVTSVKITGGDAASPNDYLHVATLEYSTDGSSWTTAGSYANQATITATLPDGARARYVRLRATAADAYWVKIHEFTVTGPPVDRPTVSGTPGAASGSSLAAAADGDLDTAYTAAAAPAAGDALVVSLPTARPLSRVAVVGSGHARVQVRRGDTWSDVGRLSSSGYTELAVGGAAVSQLRLAWTPGSPAPSIAEIVPWYADAPVATIVAQPDSVDTAVGAPATVTVQLAAGVPAATRATLSVGAPAGVSADPATSRVTLPRGSTLTRTVTLTASAAGSYPVTITLTPAHGAAVVEHVTLVVHPAVSGVDVAAAAQGATATASSVEQGLPQFTPDHAIDGNTTSTRWSSGHTDGEWLQVQFAQPQDLGKIVLTWETAHATAYQLQTSTDGTNWTTALDVTGSTGGTETDWIDAKGVKYLRMQGVARSSTYGYSLYELTAYPLA